MKPFRTALIALGVIGLGALVWTFADAPLATLGLLRDGVDRIRLPFALAGVAVSAAAIVNRGALHRAGHRAVGLDTPNREMTRTAAVGFAAQQVVRSAGIVGVAVFVRHGRRRGHAPGQVVAACVLAGLAAIGAAGLVLAATVGVLALTGELDGWWIVAAVCFGGYVGLVGVTTAVLVRSRRLAESAWCRLQRVRTAVGAGIRRLRGIDRLVVDSVRPLPAGLYDGLDAARRHPRAVRRLLVHAVLAKLLGIGALTIAAAAVGSPVGAVTALVVYATALAASAVTILPGGVGAVEGSTVALLVAAGASLPSATLAVALFRVFDLWLPLAVGAVAARRELGRSDESVEVDAGATLPVGARATERLVVPAMAPAA